MKHFLGFIVTAVGLSMFWGVSSAVAGQLVALESQGLPVDNWHVESPKIVVATALLPEKLVKFYKKVSQEKFQPLLDSNPGLSLEFLEQATATGLVEALRDPNTVGLVFISHTYQNSIGGAVMLGADYNPLPSEFLSAATPALRFLALFGCHGPDIVKQYQVRYELDRLQGKRTFYSTDDKFLSTKAFLLGKDKLKKAIGDLTARLHGEGLDLDIGALPEEFDARISVEAKDVIKTFEPRFVLVNGRIVGVLGGTDGKFNSGIEFERFEWFFSPSILRADKCQKVSLRASELTTGAPTDDYQVRSVEWEGGGRISRWTPEFPVHLGNDESIPDPEFKPPPLSRAREEFMKKNPPMWEKYQRDLAEQELRHKVNNLEWIDRAIRNWPALSGRFFSECF